VAAGIVVLEVGEVLVGAPMEVALVDHLVAWIMCKGSITILLLLVAPAVEANCVSVLGLSMGVTSFRA
jgi:hypothetical protein